MYIASIRTFQLALLASILSIAGCGGGEKSKAAKPVDPAMASLIAAYPLDTCVVSGEKLGGDHGEPHDVIHEGRLVRFCCSPCVKEFNKEPAKFLAMIDEAKAKKATPAK